MPTKLVALLALITVSVTDATNGSAWTAPPRVFQHNLNNHLAIALYASEKYKRILGHSLYQLRNQPCYEALKIYFLHRDTLQDAASHSVAHKACSRAFLEQMGADDFDFVVPFVFGYQDDWNSYITANSKEKEAWSYLDAKTGPGHDYVLGKKASFAITAEGALDESGSGSEDGAPSSRRGRSLQYGSLTEDLRYLAHGWNETHENSTFDGTDSANSSDSTNGTQESNAEEATTLAPSTTPGPDAAMQSLDEAQGNVLEHYGTSEWGRLKGVLAMREIDDGFVGSFLYSLSARWMVTDIWSRFLQNFPLNSTYEVNSTTVEDEIKNADISDETKLKTMEMLPSQKEADMWKISKQSVFMPGHWGWTMFSDRVGVRGGINFMCMDNDGAGNKLSQPGSSPTSCIPRESIVEATSGSTAAPNGGNNQNAAEATAKYFKNTTRILVDHGSFRPTYSNDATFHGFNSLEKFLMGFAELSDVGDIYTCIPKVVKKEEKAITAQAATIRRDYFAYDSISNYQTTLISASGSSSPDPRFVKIYSDASEQYQCQLVSANSGFQSGGNSRPLYKWQYQKVKNADGKDIPTSQLESWGDDTSCTNDLSNPAADPNCSICKTWYKGYSIECDEVKRISKQDIQEFVTSYSKHGSSKYKELHQNVGYTDSSKPAASVANTPAPTRGSSNSTSTPALRKTQITLSMDERHVQNPILKVTDRFEKSQKTFQVAFVGVYPEDVTLPPSNELTYQQEWMLKYIDDLLGVPIPESVSTTNQRTWANVYLAGKENSQLETQVVLNPGNKESQNSPSNSDVFSIAGFNSMINRNAGPMSFVRATDGLSRLVSKSAGCFGGVSKTGQLDLYKNGITIDEHVLSWLKCSCTGIDTCLRKNGTSAELIKQKYFDNIIGQSEKAIVNSVVNSTNSGGNADAQSMDDSTTNTKSEALKAIQTDIADRKFNIYNNHLWENDGSNGEFQCFATPTTSSTSHNAPGSLNPIGAQFYATECTKITKEHLAENYGHFAAPASTTLVPATTTTAPVTAGASTTDPTNLETVTANAGEDTTVPVIATPTKKDIYADGTKNCPVCGVSNPIPPTTEGALLSSAEKPALSLTVLVVTAGYALL